jgi:hypothetical protein
MAKCWYPPHQDHHGILYQNLWLIIQAYLNLISITYLFLKLRFQHKVALIFNKTVLLCPWWNKIRGKVLFFRNIKIYISLTNYG